MHILQDSPFQITDSFVAGLITGHGRRAFGVLSQSGTGRPFPSQSKPIQPDRAESRRIKAGYFVCLSAKILSAESRGGVEHLRRQQPKRVAAPRSEQGQQGRTRLFKVI
jgi:hypothetical protein